MSTHQQHVASYNQQEAAGHTCEINAAFCCHGVFTTIINRPNSDCFDTLM